jgi:hypothetical protein
MTISPVNPLPCLASKYLNFVGDGIEDKEFLTKEGAQPAALKRMLERLIAPKDDSTYDIDGSNILEYGFISDSVEWWWLYSWNWPEMNLRGFFFNPRYNPLSRLWEGFSD